jgi:pimeloyl-ACP methyl ester carboxylesterase/ketosteroid isomerase-like protein
MITYRTLDIDGLPIFVREAGDPRSPAIVLLHGFPTSSFMFRDLIPLLAGRFHVIAPDLPGFGHSGAPPVDSFAYTFDNLAKVTQKVLDRLEVESYVLYVHDYGGPVGMRLALAAPERVRGLVVQNANAYMEGVGEAVAGLFLPLWKEQNPTTIAAARAFLTPEATRMQYTAGARAPEALSPDPWTLDQALLDRPGNAAIQLALFVDYQTNVAAYEAWHAYFRQQRPRTLVVWGKNDPFFLAAGAAAYRRDLPEAEIVYLDGGHFALEEHAETIAAHVHRVFGVGEGALLVASFYAALAAGRLDEALALLAADVRWEDPEGFPYGGKLVGRDAVRAQVFARLGADWAPFAVTPARIVPSADGATVLVLGRYTGTHRRSGRALDVPFAHVWSTAGGVLARFETHTDTATLRDAMST